MGSRPSFRSNAPILTSTVDFLLGLLCAALITHVFAALSFPALWRSRPRQVYFAQFGLHSFLMAVHVGVRLAFPFAQTALAREVLGRVGWTTLFFGLAVLVNFALRYARTEDPKRWLLVNYVCAATFS